MKKILFVLLVSVLFSCKKDKKCNQDMGGISGTYKVTAATFKSSSTAVEQDYYATLYPNACERDDIVILNANGTYTYTDAGTKCSPAGDDTGTWSVSANQITIDGNASTIQSFSCSALVILEINVPAAGNQLKLTLTRQ